MNFRNNASNAERYVFFDLSCNTGAAYYRSVKRSNIFVQVHLKIRPCNMYEAYFTRCLKNCAKLFLPDLCQIFTNFDNFWQKDGKEAKIVRGALIFHII